MGTIESLIDLDWNGLTRAPEKPSLYVRDPFFREGWEILHTRKGSDAYDLLSATGIVVFKPEAIAFNKVHIALKLLSNANIIPIGSIAVKISPLMYRTLYAYQLSRVTAMRLRIIDLLMAKSKILLALFRDVGGQQIPTSVKLSIFKEEPLPNFEYSLRNSMGAQNKILTMIHTSDEPIDVLRELSVLLGARQGVDFLLRSWSNTVDDIESTIKLCVDSCEEKPEKLGDLSSDGTLDNLHSSTQDIQLTDSLTWNELILATGQIFYENILDKKRGIKHHLSGRNVSRWLSV